MALISNTTPPIPRTEKKPIDGGGAVLVLNVCALLSLVGAVSALLAAKSAVHEIEAVIAFLCFVCATGGSAIVSQLRALRAAANA